MMEKAEDKNRKASPENGARPVAELEKRLGLSFKNRKLLQEALTHKSYAVENKQNGFNERLELLGDAIISACVVSYLFNKHKGYDEGQISKIKSAIVSRTHLYLWAKQIGLGKYLRFSKGEELAGGRERESLVGNAFEALVGAIYLEHGFEKSKRFLWERLKRTRITPSDYKSMLQEISQKRYRLPPEYVLISESGPDHEKTFEIEVRMGRKAHGRGLGKSKKLAEQEAAKEALKSVRKGGVG